MSGSPERNRTMTMQEYWKKVRSEALDSMRRLIGQDVEDNGEGMVDVDRIRADVDAGMKASGGELELVPQFDPALRLAGLTIKNIKFTKEDFSEFFGATLPSVSPTAVQ
jgi:hypothetical protein